MREASKPTSRPGSEPFTWKLFEGIPRQCCICEKPLRVKDVRRHHTEYRQGKAVWTGFFCSEHVHEQDFLPIGHPTC